MFSVEKYYEELSPLMDDVLTRLARLPASRQERAAIASLLMTQVSVAARKSMMEAMHSPDQISEETSKHIANVLIISFAKADAEIEAMSDTYESMGNLQ